MPPELKIAMAFEKAKSGILDEEIKKLAAGSRRGEKEKGADKEAENGHGEKSKKRSRKSSSSLSSSSMSSPARSSGSDNERGRKKKSKKRRKRSSDSASSRESEVTQFFKNNFPLQKDCCKQYGYRYCGSRSAWIRIFWLNQDPELLLIFLIQQKMKEHINKKNLILMLGLCNLDFVYCRAVV